MLLLAVGGCAATGRPSPTAAERAVPSLGCFSRVDNRLYRGAQPDEDDLRDLAELGIRTIVSLRVLHDGREQAEGLGLRYHRISMNIYHPEYEDVLRFLRIVTDPDSAPVFVHCNYGVDRTGFMVAAYRVVVQAWNSKDAIAEMKAQGFHQVNMIAEDFIEDLDVERLRRELSLRPAVAPSGKIRYVAG